MSERRFGWTMLCAFAWKQRQGGPGRTALALATPALALLGFALANTIAANAALVTDRDLARRPPGVYDLLVRSSSAVSALERSSRLIAPDELRWGSSITIAQWQDIAHLPDVETAAPVAPAGTLELTLPAGAAATASRRAAVVDVTVAGIDPTAETRLVHLDKALLSGLLLPAAIPPRERLTPPFLLAAAPAAGPRGQSVGTAHATTIDLLHLAAGGAIGGGLLPPAIDRYTAVDSLMPGAAPLIERASAADLPSLPRTATSWLSIGSPAGGVDGVIDSTRLLLGDPRLDPLPFALYGHASGPSDQAEAHMLLTDVRSICRLLGDGCISAVRVRVAAPEGINGRRAAVVATVARAIERRTGLWVDVVYGATGRTVHVVNASGGQGGSGTELWLAKGATLAISQGVNAINLALFSLIAVVAALSIVSGTVVTALRRAPEKVILLHNGWNQDALRRLALVDTALVGSAAGLLALPVLVATLIVGWTTSSPTLWAVLPLIIVAYALGAALGHALARIDRVVGAPKARGGRDRFVPWWLVLALRNGWRRPLRGALAILSAGGAATVFTILLLGVTTLHGLLSVTVLGQGIAVELAPYHLGLGAIAVALTLVTLADLAIQGVRERRVELGTLRALGFSSRAVLRLVVVEAGLTAVVGSLLGVAVTTLVIIAVYGPAIDRALLGPAVVASCGAAIALCVAAAILPAARATRITPAEAQRNE